MNPLFLVLGCNLLHINLMFIVILEPLVCPCPCGWLAAAMYIVCRVWLCLNLFFMHVTCISDNFSLSTVALLERSFLDHAGNFKIVHINAESVSSHFEENQTIVYFSLNNTDWLELSLSIIYRCSSVDVEDSICFKLVCLIEEK